jgi:hypothetical protein
MNGEATTTVPASQLPRFSLLTLLVITTISPLAIGYVAFAEFLGFALWDVLSSGKSLIPRGLGGSLQLALMQIETAGVGWLILITTCGIQAWAPTRVSLPLVFSIGCSIPLFGFVMWGLGFENVTPWLAPVNLTTRTIIGIACVLTWRVIRSQWTLDEPAAGGKRVFGWFVCIGVLLLGIVGLYGMGVACSPKS